MEKLICQDYRSLQATISFHTHSYTTLGWFQLLNTEFRFCRKDAVKSQTWWPWLRGHSFMFAIRSLDIYPNSALGTPPTTQSNGTSLSKYQ